MNAPVKTTEIAAKDVPTVPGTPFGGGFYAGRILVDGAEHAVIVAPKAEGEHQPAEWGEYGQEVAGANSFFNGAANTRAMSAAGCPLAVWALALSIGGFSDWHLPSRDELEICYRNLKPTTETNVRWRGDNPSSVPVGYPYSLDAPAQTASGEFKEGGSEAFDDSWYWSSTQCSAYYAWGQGFSGGYAGNFGGGGKLGEWRARAVRTIPIFH